jgi:hypothetical protein
MNHAVEVGSGDIIYIPSSIKISSGTRRLERGDTDRQHVDLISLLFSKYGKFGKKKYYIY